MRYLVISDIHSNWEALQAVLKSAEGEYDRVACLGDFVGYGPDPNRVVEWAQEHVHVAVRGNHDVACIDGTGLEDFSPLAASAALWTAGELNVGSVSYLRELSKGPVTENGFGMVHGSPRDENEYVVDRADAQPVFLSVQDSVTFFGHTHLQRGFSLRAGTVRNIAIDIPLYMGPNNLYLINPGSVGQPRDHDPRAAFAIFETESRFVDFRRAEYRIYETQRKIVAAGLPLLLAERLDIGK